MSKGFSQASVNRLSPEASPYEVRDTQLKGLILRVQPSGTKTYYLEYRRGKRIHIGRANVITPQEARTQAREHLSVVYSGKDPEVVSRQLKGLTLGQFIDREYEAWAHANLRTAAKVLQRVRANFRKALSLRLPEITPYLFEKHRTWRLKNGFKPGTVNRDLDDLRAILSKAVEWGFLQDNPLLKVKRSKVDRQGVIRYLEEDEEKRLVAAIDERDERKRQQRDNYNEHQAYRHRATLPSLRNQLFVDHIKPMFLIALHTGIRRGELFQLTWEDVELTQKRITVQGIKSKNQQTRFIPLNKVALKALEDWSKQPNLPDNPDNLVFPGKHGRQFDNIRWAWRDLLESAEIKKFRWHDLRHTFASRLVMAGVALTTVRELMGHSDFKMTLRYAHLAPEHKADAVALLEK